MVENNPGESMSDESFESDYEVLYVLCGGLSLAGIAFTALMLIKF
jgi:hypothetical protein